MVYVKLYSEKRNEIYSFLKAFYEKCFNAKKLNVTKETLEWKKDYLNPIEIVDIITSFVENNNKYKINLWISLDEDILININDDNSDEIIRYLFERFPY